jgi:hypothetical protein
MPAGVQDVLQQTARENHREDVLPGLLDRLGRALVIS